MPNDQDNRAAGWVELVTGDELRQGPSAPVHPLVMRNSISIALETGLPILWQEGDASDSATILAELEAELAIVKIILDPWKDKTR